MTTITKTDNRKLVFCGVQEGHAIVSESEGYMVGQRKRWSKTIMAITPDEMRKILTEIEKGTK